jgi:formate hydrogenlyase transcriptional activator
MHMVRKHSRRQNKKITRLSQKTMNLLQTYHWPGNVRELENLVERAVILCEGDTLSIDERWLAPGPAPPPGEFKTLDEVESHLQETEKRFFQNVLMSTGGRVYGPHGAAELLKMKPTTLQSRLKTLGL